MIEINKIYDYVFGAGASIKEDVAPEQRTKLEKQIQEKFASILKSNLALPFRKLLREVKSEGLEKALYGNTTDSIPVPDSTPDYKPSKNEDIKLKFKALNEKYLYFYDKNGKPNPAAEKKFIEIFKACKLIADFVECNNNADDEVAYFHAYKILVLFGVNAKPFDCFEAYVKRLNKGNKAIKAFYHDALMGEIPKNDPCIDLKKWQKLNNMDGLEAVKLFQRAPDIEKALGGKAPKDLNEAKLAAAQARYQRARENLELARLCMKQAVSEASFNKSLDTWNARKRSDLLPSVIIDGNVVKQPGYFLVKLPPTDMNALFLGIITHCCQSIGGDSERCVIDGITLQSNGFYVLVKGKKATAKSPTLFNGEINYKEFDIVGQGYVWFSERGNLAIDSWENLRPEVDDAIIIPMLEEFGRQITEENSEIFQVTIGVGGKTPAALKDKSLKSPEKIREGFHYHDSKIQSLVYRDEEKIKKLHAEFIDQLTPLLQIKLNVEDLKKFICLDEIVSPGQAKICTELLSNPAYLSFWKEMLGEHSEKLPELIININEMGFDFWEALLILSQKKYPLLKKSIFDKLFTISPARRKYIVYDLILGIDVLQNIGMLNEGNLIALVNNILAAKEIEGLIATLKSIDKLSDINVQRAISCPYISCFKYFSKAIVYLEKKGKLTDDIFNALLLDLNHAGIINCAIYSLSSGGTALTDEDLALALTVGTSVVSVNPAVVNLIEVNPSVIATLIKAGLWSDEICQLLLQQKGNIHNPIGIFSIIDYIPGAVDLFDKAAMLTTKNLKLFLNALCRVEPTNDEEKKDCQYLASVFYNFKDMLDDPVMCKFLEENILKVAMGGFGLNGAIRELQQLGILNDMNFKTLLNHKKDYCCISGALCQLHKAGKLTDRNRKLVDQYGENNYSIADILTYPKYASLTDGCIESLLAILQNETSLSKNTKEIIRKFEWASDAQLFSDYNIKFIITHVNDIEKIKQAVSLLGDNSLLNNENFKMLMGSPEKADTIAEFIVEVSKSKPDSELFELHKIVGTIPALFLTPFKHVLSGLPPEISPHVLSCIRELHEGDILDEKNFHDIIKNAQHAQGINLILSTLNKMNKLDNNSFEVILSVISKFHFLSSAIADLVKVGVWNDEVCQVLLQQKDSSTYLCEALVALHLAGILDRGNAEILVFYPEQIEKVSKILIELSEAKNLKEVESVKVKLGIFRYIAQDQKTIVNNEAGFFATSTDNNPMQKLNDRIDQRMAELSGGKTGNGVVSVPKK